MAAKSKKGALTAGIIMITIGVIFLMENWYATFSVWNFVARYWPLILIYIGARKIYLYFTWPEVPSVSGSPSKE